MISRYLPNSRLVAMGLAALLLAGCGGAAQPAPPSSAAPAAPPAASAAAKPAVSAVASASSGLTKLLVPFSSTSADTVSSWVALDGGYFQKNGLDVDLRYVAGGTKTMAALMSGEGQLSEQGGNEAMSAVAGGADLVLIAGLMPVYPFKLEAIPGINSLEDLKGKKLAVSSVGGTADVALRVFLRKHGIDPDKDVQIVAVGDPATVLGALKSRAVSASLQAMPNLLQAEAAGTHPIGDMASEKIPNAQNSLTVQHTWLNANRPIAQKFVDALIQAHARIRQDKAFTEQMMIKYIKYTDPKGLDETYDFNVNEVWPVYPHIRPEQLADGLTELGKKNEKLRGFDPASMLDDSLVQDAEKRGVAGA
jgi:NitT/TauT family transport system substrate-binding protein